MSQSYVRSRKGLPRARHADRRLCIICNNQIGIPCRHTRLIKDRPAIPLFSEQAIRDSFGQKIQFWPLRFRATAFAKPGYRSRHTVCLAKWRDWFKQGYGDERGIEMFTLIIERWGVGVNIWSKSILQPRSSRVPSAPKTQAPMPLHPQKIPVGSALISRSTAPKSGVGGRGS